MQHRRPTIKALLHIGADRSIKSADLVEETEELHQELRKSGKLKERTVKLPLPPEAGADRESLRKYFSGALEQLHERDHPPGEHWMLLSIELTEESSEQDLSVEGVLRDLSQQFQEQLCYKKDTSKGPGEEPALLSKLEELVQGQLDSVIDQLAATSPSDQMSTEVRYGFGSALGRWLAEWYLGRLDPGGEAGFDEFQDAGLDPALEVSELCLDVGSGLVYLISEGKDSPLVAEVQRARRELAEGTGFVMPPMNFRETPDFANNEYRLYLREREIAGGVLKLGHILTTGETELVEQLGEVLEHPAIDGPATWIRAERAPEATALGCRCLLPGEVIGQHILMVVEDQAWQLMSIQATSQLLDRLMRYEPALVMELDRADVPTRLIRHVLRDLLRESIPIRDLVTILEAILDHLDGARSPEALTEAVRAALAPSVFVDLMDDDGVLEAVALSQGAEQFLRQAADEASGGLPVSVVSTFVEAMEQVIAQGRRDEIVIVSPPLRLLVRRLTEKTHPEVLVISHYEVPPEAQLVIRDTVHIEPPPPPVGTGEPSS